MKAVVLARGAGSRMREATGATLTGAQAAAASAGQKAMMPIGGGRSRPFLDFVLGSIAEAGCRDVCIVVAPDHDAIRRYYRDERPPSRIRISYAVQAAPLGTANAVLSAKAFAHDEPFLTLNADNVYPVEAVRALVALPGPGLPAFERDALAGESGFPPERLAAFALIESDPSGRLLSIIEKPGRARMEAAGPAALVSMNVWRFDARIFDACRDVPVSARGEYELPEAVALALSRGVEFQVVRARGPVVDLTWRADVAEATRRLDAIEARP